MKSLFFTIVLFVTGNAFVQAGNYREVMQENITKMYQGKTAGELTAIANTFARIAQKETTEWLPDYYAAYSYISICFYGADAAKVDEYLDLAQPFIDAGKKLAKNESELMVLQSLLYSMRITDMSRGMKYSGLSMAELEKAKAVTPGNPRIYFCMGNNIFHTPEAFGGGTKNAKPLFKKAVELYNTWTSPDALWPAWGKEQANHMLEQCNETQN